MEFLFTVVILTIVLTPFAAHYYRLYRQKRHRFTTEKLCRMLFPGDTTGAMRNNVVEDIMDLTSRHYSEDEVLDYYLKIKGLQLVDINSFNDPDLCEFLMQPTKIRLQYRELVSFYERYLDQPQATGVNAAD